MIRNPNIIDRLYLAQGDEDTIYIDNDKIPQQTIDGIRFLYKQFRRRKNGVILNDPFSFGRNIQICLFVKAVRPLLHRPILILCQEGTEKEWVDRFDTWTNESLINEVAIETLKPFVNKMVMINTMVNLHLFCAREWSIIIVDGDQVTTPNPILKLPFKACFKIWNTSVDVKHNLDRFEEVYKWLYPRAPFDKNYYIADSKNVVDVMEKAILIDTLCEDIVLRRDDGISFESLHRAYDKTSKKCVTTITAMAPTTPLPYRMVGDTSIHPVRRTTATPTTVAPTNGDPIILKNTLRFGDTTITPTKVVPINVAPPNVVPTNVALTTIAPTNVASTTVTPITVSPTTVTPTTVTPTTVTPTTVTPSTSSAPTVTITKKNKDATGTKIKRSKSRIIESETANKSFTPASVVLTKLLEESPKTEDNDGKFCKTVDFCIENYNRKNGQNNGKINTESKIEIIDIHDKTDDVPQTLGDKLEELDTIVYGHDTLISKVSAIEISAKGNNSPTDRKETEPHTILTCKPVGEHNTRNKLFTDNKRSIGTMTSETSPGCSDETERDKKNDRKLLKSKSKVSTDQPEVGITKIKSKVSTDQPEVGISKIKSKVSTDQPEVGITKINMDELNREMRDLGTGDKTEQLVKRQKTTHGSETATCYDDIIKKFSEHNKHTNISFITKVNAEQISNSLKRNNVDVQMKECEEAVSKKFKGSLLDRLF